MPKYRIPYTFMEWGYLDIEAPNLEEAERIIFEEITYAELHAESNYVDDSLAIDKESAIYGELKEGGETKCQDLQP